MHFVKQAKCIRAACSFQNHNKKIRLIADFCIKDRGPVRKKPKSECIFCLYPNAFSCFRFEKVQKEHAALHIWKARPNALFRPGKMHSAISDHPYLFGFLHYNMKNKRNNKKSRLNFTTSIYPTGISRAYQMHFSSPEECIWHWFPIMFSLGFCWLMTYSILLIYFLYIKVAVGCSTICRNTETDPESGRICSGAFFKMGRIHSRSLLLPQP